MFVNIAVVYITAVTTFHMRQPGYRTGPFIDSLQQYSPFYAIIPFVRSKWLQKKGGSLSIGCKLLVHVRVLHWECRIVGLRDQPVINY